MKKFLFYIAVTGWTLGLLVHLLAIGDIDITNQVPFVWILHVGIFVVWLPTIFSLTKNEELKKNQRSAKPNPMKFFTIIFAQTPTWLVIVAIAGFFYASINFMLFMTSQPGLAGIQDGQYVLQDHGKLIKTLTAQEYQHFKANEIRGFSGHWIAFYGLAAAILFPFHQKATNE